jgi:hypothetical protein
MVNRSRDQVAPVVGRRLMARVLQGVVAALITAAAALLSLILLFVAGWKCDENCDLGSGSWSADPGAWQWDALAGLAVVAFVPVVVAVVLWAKRRDRAAAVSLGLAAVVYLVTWTLIP